MSKNRDLLKSLMEITAKNDTPPSSTKRVYGLPSDFLDTLQVVATPEDVKILKKEVNEQKLQILAGFPKNTTISVVYNQVAQKYGYKNWSELITIIGKPEKSPEQIRALETLKGTSRWWSISFCIPSLKEIKMKHLYEIRKSILKQNLDIPEEERLPDTFRDTGPPASIIFNKGSKITITGIGHEGGKALKNNATDRLLMMIRAIHPDAFISKRVNHARFTFSYSRGDKKYQYYISSLALSKPRANKFAIKNIHEYVRSLLMRDMTRLFSFIHPLKSNVDWGLEIKVNSMSRPTFTQIDNEMQFLVLPQISFEANVKMIGPYYVGFMTHVGYGQLKIIHTEYDACQF